MRSILLCTSLGQQGLWSACEARQGNHVAAPAQGCVTTRCMEGSACEDTLWLLVIALHALYHWRCLQTGRESAWGWLCQAGFVTRGADGTEPGSFSAQNVNTASNSSTKLQCLHCMHGKPPSGERQQMACVAALNQAQVHYGKINPTMCHNAAAAPTPCGSHFHHFFGQSFIIVNKAITHALRANVYKAVAASPRHYYLAL